MKDRAVVVTPAAGGAGLATVQAEAEQKLRVATRIADHWGELPDLAATVTTVIESYRSWGGRPHAKKVPPANVVSHLATIEAGLGNYRVAFLTTDQVRDDFLEPLAAEVDEITFYEVLDTLIHLLDHALHGYAARNPDLYYDALPARYKVG